MSKRLVHLYRYLTDEECIRFKMPLRSELQKQGESSEAYDDKKYITHDEVWMDDSEIQALRLTAPKGSP